MSLLCTDAPSELCEVPHFGNVSSYDEPESFTLITGKMRIHRRAQQGCSLKTCGDRLNKAVSHLSFSRLFAQHCSLTIFWRHACLRHRE
jgi:hypothetical protein